MLNFTTYASNAHTHTQNVNHSLSRSRHIILFWRLNWWQRMCALFSTRIFVVSSGLTETFTQNTTLDNTAFQISTWHGNIKHITKKWASKKTYIPHTSFALRWHRTDHQNPNTLNMALNPVIAYVIFPSCTKRDKLPVKSAMEKADETCDFQSSKLGTRQ